MAKSSKTSTFQSFKKSQALLLLLALLLNSSLCHVHPLEFSVSFDASSAQRGRALLEINPTNKQSSSTMKIHEEQTHKNPTTTSSTSSPATAAIPGTDGSAAASKDRQFGMAAHQVPSGPNPESNR